ncbi:MAG: HipA domain-containing protein, partial [Staphylococcus epidermidis]|nr:HipA domain-containing protein [Staphylococcus epidermidis]
DSPTTEIEMVYSEMAKAAGINMMPCFLKEIDGRNHFVTERFDRKNGEKLFSQTLAAIMPGADDYMKLCWIAETLKLPQEDKDQIFIRMVFN